MRKENDESLSSGISMQFLKFESSWFRTTRSGWNYCESCYFIWQYPDQRMHQKIWASSCKRTHVSPTNIQKMKKIWY